MSLSRWEWLLDSAALIAALTAASATVARPSLWTVALCTVMIGALASRRRYPTSAAVVAVAGSGIALVTPVIAFPLWVMAEVVLFTLALRCARRVVLLIGGAHVVLMYLGALIVFGTDPYDPGALLLPVWTAAVIATGLALRANDDYVRALETQTRMAIAHRESEVSRHVGEERLRIARDLHDSVAHGVSVIAIHAGSAERFLDRDPDRARTSLALVRASSRAVIDELQDILLVLREPGSDATASDVVGIDAVPALIETTRAAGLNVTVDTVAWPPMDRSIGVAIYRILQESLTNARKHGAHGVTIRTRIEGPVLLLHVQNDVVGCPADGDGFGLLGMAERAASVHGTVETTSGDGVFTVDARLPLHAPGREAAR